MRSRGSTAVYGSLLSLWTFPSPPSTVPCITVSAGHSFDTVMRICKILGIKAMSDDAALYLTDDTERLLTQYAKLDDYGRHTISSVMQVEYDRCSGEK